MVLVLKELLNQTAVNVTLLEMQPMPFTKTKITSAYVSLGVDYSVLKGTMNKLNAEL